MSKKRKKGQQGKRRRPLHTKKRGPILPNNTQGLSKNDLNNYKQEMNEVIEYANFRIDNAIRTNNKSLELERFLDGDDTKRFSISQLSDPSDLKAYMTEVRTILATIDTGTRKGEVDSAIMEAEAFRNQFGNQHRNVYIDEEGRMRVRHFNTNDVFDEEGNIIRRAVDPEIASKAFSAYRRLEQDYAGYIGRQGQEMMFGSENLIILLYDFYDRNPGADYDYNTKGNTYDALEYAKPLLDEWINNQLLELGGINYSFSDAIDIISSWQSRIDRGY